MNLIFKNAGFALVCFCLLISSCSKPVPNMNGIDMVAWKQDKKACGGARARAIEPLREQKNKLQGLSEMDLVSLLGRPDQQELYKRNQKFYYYWLEPGKECGLSSDGRRLSIRFNATGASKEIAVE